MAYAAATDGGEWHGQCPVCGRQKTGDSGDDRFVVAPNKGDCGRFFCRKNPDHNGDGIDYLRRYRGMGFRDACTLLGVARDYNGNGYDGRPAQPHTWAPRPVALPPNAWREAAAELVREAQANLFDMQSGQDHLAWLDRRRMIAPETARRAGLGLVCKTHWFPKEDWGLPPDGNRPNLWVPTGTLLPVMADGCVAALSVRRFDGDEPRYVRISGSSNKCAWFGPAGNAARTVIVLESVLDALLLTQELPADVAVLALGAASVRPDAGTAEQLHAAPIVLCALDGDGAGAANAIGWWEANFRTASRLAYPKHYKAKDPTELAVAHGNTDILRAWVEVGIEIAESRLAVRRTPPTSSAMHIIDKTPAPPPPETLPAAPARNAQEQPTRAISVEAGPSLDMRVTVVNSPGGLDAALARVAAFDGIIGLDTETTPLPQFQGDDRAALDPFRSRVRTLQVSTGNEVFVFDLNRIDIRTLTCLAARRWCGHNSVFDVKMLTHAGLECPPPDCTMLLANAIDNDTFSLRALAAKHLELVLDKSVRTEDWSGDLSREQIQYAARDAWATFRLHRRLADQAEQRGRMRLYGLLKGVQAVVARMELCGIKLDLDAHACLVDDWRADLDVAMADVHAAFGDKFNPNSSKQVGDLLREHLDPDTLAAWPLTESGALSTTAGDLAIVADHPALARVAAARSLSHMLSGFGEKLAALVNPVTGRAHPHLMIAAQSTGRFSCTNPNMHGVPRDKRVRSLFITEPGRAIVAADFGMVQLRIAALISRDARLVSATERGEDLHQLTASLLMGKRPEDVTKEERSLVKPVNFGLLFCMGSCTLFHYARTQYHVNMSIGDAARFREGYFEAYPGIRAWHRQVRDQLAEGGKVQTPCGRWSRFPKEGDPSLPGAAAHVIQGAEAEVMQATLGRLLDALRGLDAVPVACIHDEVILDVAEADVPAAEVAVREAMECGMRDVFPKAPLIKLVEAKHGANWGAAK